jgi:1-acyl-sn-glycerol-3-phosphate acyltransferase
MRDSRGEVLRRRAVTVPGVVVAAWVLAILFLPLGALLVAVDLLRLKFRLPLLRLAGFGLCWAWLETVGVAAAAGLWLAGRARDIDAHYRLQRWWAARLMASLRVTCGITIHVEGVDRLHPAPVALLVRHASLADSLLTAWVVTEHAHLRPRIVLKRELLSDPCLDIVGNRLPNCFLDRQAEDSGPGLAEIEQMGATMDDRSVSIIFPEGTRANPGKRRRALERIEQRDPDRAERLSGLSHVLPPRPAGTRALLRGAAAADAGVAVGWHVGFDGLDTFAGILAALARPRTPIRMRVARVDPPSQLEGAEFDRWLDDLWVQVDRDVATLGAGG